MAPLSIFKGTTPRFIGVTALVVFISMSLTGIHTTYGHHKQLIRARRQVFDLVRQEHFPARFLNTLRRAIKKSPRDRHDILANMASKFFIGDLPDIAHVSIHSPGSDATPYFSQGLELPKFTDEDIAKLQRSDTILHRRITRGTKIILMHACPITPTDRSKKTVAILQLASTLPTFSAFWFHVVTRDAHVILLIFIIATLISTVIIGYLTRSLRSVASYAQAIERGEIEEHVAITGHDEASSIAAALNVVLERLRDSYISTLGALAALLETKDYATETHSLRGVRYAMELGRSAGLSRKELEELEHGAMLHDIGKIGVADIILTKAGPLTEEEWAKIREHPTIGYNVLKHLEFLKNAMPVILYHQERHDGRGYPKGLKGQEIPLLARIFTIADSFDAMTSDRPYRKAMASELAIQEIMRNSGTQFDPKLVELFVKLYTDGRLHQIEEDLTRQGIKGS